MPRKRKANIAQIQNLQGGGDTSSFKRQKSTGADSDSNGEMASDDDVASVCLKSNYILI
jgi:hypothetical protein